MEAARPAEKARTQVELETEPAAQSRAAGINDQEEVVLATPCPMNLMNDTNNDKPQEKKTMLDNAALIRRLYDAVNQKDLKTIADFGTASSEWLDVPFDYTSKGERAIIDPWQSWFDIFPDATCEVRSLVAFGDRVVAQGIGRGTHKGAFNSPAGTLPPTGRAMEVRFCDIYRLENGKIVRADSYFDFYGLLKQLAPERA